METTCPIKALAGYVILEAIDHEEQITASGIVVPIKQKANALVRGRVLSAGRFVDTVDSLVYESPVKVGDVIMYRKYEAEKIEHDSKYYYRLPCTRVSVVVEE